VVGVLWSVGTVLAVGRFVAPSMSGASIRVLPRGQVQVSETLY
jgi:hypothetical protein